MNFWQRKLLAFLHDPPGKPFNVVERRVMAESLVRSAGFEPGDVSWFFDKVCDRVAAAADRVCFPGAGHLKSEFRGDASSPFHHPLGGGKLVFEKPVPSAAFAEDVVAGAQPHSIDLSAIPEGDRDRAKFFLHWRLWARRAFKADGRTAHIPADTRIPDHTIWTHCSITSALQACVEVTREGPNAEVGEFEPAFLLVQIGPVQEFIAQARTTRDLWSGSYLLSWLIAHGLKAVTDAVGPDAVLFPSLRGQPLFDFLHKANLYEPLGRWGDLGHADEHILTPNLPNRFLAVVPFSRAQELAKAAEEAMRRELAETISEGCLRWFKGKGHEVEADALARWNQQLRQFLTVQWQVAPWETDVEKALAGFQDLPMAKDRVESQTATPAETLRLMHEAATQGMPAEHLDPRNYRHRSWREGNLWKSEVVPGADGRPVIENPGFAWAAHYAKAEFLLAARRNTRDFEPWAVEDERRQGSVKDMLSGKEETIGSEEWQKGLAGIKGHFFRENERLGAMNLLKRVWHEACLRQVCGLKRLPRFDSLTSVAAASFALRTVDAMKESGAAWSCLVDFQKAAVDAREDFDAPISGVEGEGTWVGRTDASVFHSNEWDRAVEEAEGEGKARLKAARDALKKLLEKLGDKPRGYVAVLAMDGDSMGQWVSGAKAPEWKTQLSSEAAKYFAGTGAILPKLLEAPRHVSPSYHLQLSEALANFAIYLAGPIVESFDGQVIYAGGDDVLALLPAGQALACARALRMAFRGDPKLSESWAGALPAKPEQWGFVGLNGNADGMRRRFLPIGWPLIVPGQRADISAGIAFGHMHSPLQNLVEAARKAEKRAKKFHGKAAFSVSLFKRSGETNEWGARWESRAMDLAKRFTDLTEAGSLSGRFPYALARLLRPYATDSDFRIAAKGGFDPLAVFPSELRHVAGRQGRMEKGERNSFCALAEDYLKECQGRTLDDFLGPFLTESFIQRGGE